MVNKYKLKLTLLQQDIFELLQIYAGLALNQRGIANKLGVSAPAVMKSLPGLEESGLIKTRQDKESKRWAIELNRDDHRIMQLKRANNLKLLYKADLVEYLEDAFPGGTIILFGSYSRGEDTINSDIDIAIIGRKEKIQDLTKFEKTLNRRISLNFYESFDKIHKNLKENLFNGITLSGGIQL
ncbi:hypothetical protein COT47_07610 [Candidatus Woesearchaeota archaeon CG08_land_8_20_14_0_20_43_7]|nr:MAG: hypothetical protein COT47_07610 [Candidatus Woesearchaeota archaeon CG08_land_8_20_14_0_20_43_7]